MEQTKNQYVMKTVRPVKSDYSEEGSINGRQPDDPKWKPGFFNQFPTLGFAALFTAIVCAAGSVLTLELSNDKSQAQWPEKLAPNVILSGLNSIANICYGIAMANGIAIAWWRQALKGATIKQLHKSWSFSSSLKSIATAGKYFNVIALAALTTKLTIVDNMLMQRATTTTSYLDGPYHLNNMTMYANDSIPQTGSVQGRSGSAKILDTELNKNLILWEANGGQVSAHGNGTAGIYFMNVSAAGFSFECSEPVMTAINYGQETQNATSFSGQHNSSSPNPYDPSPTLFNLTFGVLSTGVPTGDGNPETGAYSYLQMNVTWTAAEDTAEDLCPGSKTVQTCKLRPAVVQYPIVVQNTTSKDYNAYTTAASFFAGTLLAFDTENDYMGIDAEQRFGDYNSAINQTNGFEVLSYKDLYENGALEGASSSSTLGGLQAALTQYLGGDASVSFSTVGFEVTQTGNAQQWLQQTPNSSYGCGYNYVDPVNVDVLKTGWVMTSVLTSINQIMFTLATDPYYASNYYDDAGYVVQLQTTRNATLYHDEVYYVTNYAYMWGAVASMLVCIILILPSYYGYWQLGRKVSLGPMEIAHAFRSPMTAVGSNGDIDQLMKEVGKKNVKYGQISKGDAKGVLGIAEPENIAGVNPNIGSARKEMNEKMQAFLARR